jgi:hypothetical protein
MLQEPGLPSRHSGVKRIRALPITIPLDQKPTPCPRNRERFNRAHTAIGNQPPTSRLHASITNAMTQNT